MTLLDVQDEPMMKSTKTGGLIPNVKESELSQTGILRSNTMEYTFKTKAMALL